MSLLSIITINYNDALGLEKTINSVVNQSWCEFEYIVIDGGSTDGSLNVIEKNKNKITYFVSEKDKGIYNAMNKGIVKANGKYILFLNSGDYLVNSEVLENVVEELLNDIDFISGNLEYFDSKGKLFVRKHPEKLTFSYLVSKTISHPSTFIKKIMFDKYGLYNEDLKIVSDWEFFFKCLGLNGASYKSTDVTLTHFDMTGISSSNGDKVNAEKQFVFKKYLPTIFNDEMDTYIFNKYIENNKRIKHLKIIDESQFLRKIATIFLTILSKIRKF